MAEKTVVLFGMQGDTVTLGALPDAPLRFLFASARPLREEVAWGGPIVMNTREELERTLDELRVRTFVLRWAQGTGRQP